MQEHTACTMIADSVRSYKCVYWGRSAWQARWILFSRGWPNIR